MRDWRAYVRQRLGPTTLRPGHEQNVIDNLADQLEQAYREAIGRGLPDIDADAAACGHITDWPTLARQLNESRRLSSSRMERMENQLVDAGASGRRGAGIFGGLVQDVRFAFRMFRKTPGLTAIAVLMLALGIGANTTIFSWVNAILLDPLPGADARRIVDIGFESKSSSRTSMSYPDFLDLRDAASTLQGLAVHDMQAASVAAPAGAERIWLEIVSDNFFDVLGVKLIEGRTFRPEEGRTPTPVVVISEGLWRQRFGSVDLVDKAIDINGTPFTVVGIAPAEFPSGYTGLSMDAWVPVPMVDKVMAGAGNRATTRGVHWLDTLGRLKPGISTTQASLELTALASRLPDAITEAGARMRVVPLWQSPDGAQSVMGAVLLVLMGMVAIVLLIACANLANLLLSRASARQREFAVRLSLGCGRGRLVRQLLTEAAVLVSLGAVAAALAQLWTGGLLGQLVPPTDLPIRISGSLDARVLAFVAVAALASAILFGLAPALQAGRTDLVVALKLNSSQAGAQRSWLRSTLVVSQVAFTMLLLASAGLFIRSVSNAGLFNFGFRSDHMLLASVDLFTAGYDRTRGRQALTDMLDGVRVLPSVESVTLARRVPLGIATGNSSTSLEPEGYVAPKDEPAYAYYNWVGPDYFRTMGIPLLAGREYATRDRAEEPEVLVINRTFATRFWPGQDPIGKRVRLGPNWYAVAGVVADSKYRRLSEPPLPFVYLSTTWNYRPDVTLQIRTTTAPELIAGPVRDVVKRIDPKLPVFGVMTLEDHIRSASFQQRLAAMVLSVFGGLALLLASVGLYATMAYAVSRRTRELGARLAMGATRADITRLVLGQAFRLTTVGLLIGLAISAGAAQLFKTLLLGVQPLDLVTFIGVTMLLAAIALVASYVPARRASRLDPLKALRYE